MHTHHHHEETWSPDDVFVSEGTIPGTKKYRTSMKDVIRRTDDLFRSVIPIIQGHVLRASDAEGNLRDSYREQTMRSVGETVQGLFVASDGRSSFAADGVTAISPYAQMLNELYVRVVMEAIYGMRDWMAKSLPPDVFRWLANQRFDIRLHEAENPFLRRDGEDDEAFTARLKDLRVLHPNPLMELDPNRQWVPMHKWNAPGEPQGYRLSDRIWGTSNETRKKIDQMISQAFAENWGALQLSKKLEQFLLPSAANLKTKAPYGVNASYHAMRLARTEIARAANHAAYMSAYLNPYVDRIDIARSSNGDPNCKICPDHATIGIGGGRIRPSYSIHSAVYPVFHSQCKCHVRPVLTDAPETVTMRLRAVMEDARVQYLPAAITPAAADNFTKMLLHQALGTIVGQFRGQFPLPGF